MKTSVERLRQFFGALLFLGASFYLAAAEPFNEDEWYDPASWFDQNNYEYDDRLGLDYNYYWADFEHIGKPRQPRAEESQPAQARAAADGAAERVRRSVEGGRTEKIRRVQGEVDSWANLSVRDRQGRREVHRIANVTLHDGRSVLIDLGNRFVDLRDGDHVLARGHVGSINGRKVLMAASIQVNGQAFELQGRNEHPALHQNQSRNPARLRGMVSGIEMVRVRDNGRWRVLPEITVDTGNSAIIDVGEGQRWDGLDIGHNDHIHVQGRRDSAGGKAHTPCRSTLGGRRANLVSWNSIRTNE